MTFIKFSNKRSDTNDLKSVICHCERIEHLGRAPEPAARFSLDIPTHFKIEPQGA